MPKLCQDCKWFIPPTPLVARCGHSSALRTCSGSIDLVTGEITPEYSYRTSCDSQRTDPWLMALILGTCGTRGWYWEPKE